MGGLSKKDKSRTKTIRKMNIKRLFFSEIIHLPDTKYNKNISLIHQFGEPTLIVDGLVESGFLLTNIWSKGINAHIPKSFSPNTILILGLGGGSNTILVSKRYPKAKITAVEIDAKMVDIAKKYYKINRVKNLKIVISDAIDFIDNLKNTTYDLILVDCFEGKYIPKKLQDPLFIKKVYNHGQYTLVNRIWYNEHHQETVFFLKSLTPFFLCSAVHTKTNIVISLY